MERVDRLWMVTGEVLPVPETAPCGLSIWITIPEIVKCTTWVMVNGIVIGERGESCQVGRVGITPFMKKCMD